MSLWTLVRRSLGYYWRTNLAVAAGVAVAVAALVGSLLVGDSVSGSLRRHALERLGRADWSLERGSYFRETLAAELAGGVELSGSVETCVGAILLDGSARLPEGGAPVGRVAVLGVTGDFWRVAGEETSPPLSGRDVAINRWLAEDLGAKEGDAILVSVGRKGSAPLETIFGRRKLADTVRTMRLIVRRIVSEKGAGAFTLRADRPRPRNLYVPLAWLQERLGRPGRVNTLLLASKGTAGGLEKKLNDALKSALTLADYDLVLTPGADNDSLILKSTQVVLPPAVVRAVKDPQEVLIHGDRVVWPEGAAEDSGLDSARCSVYLANSMTAVGKDAKPVVLPYSVIAGDLMPPGEVFLNEWAAQDLSVREGDRVSASFFVSGPKGELETRTMEFDVVGVLPLKGNALDRSFVPEFEGMTETKHIADWTPPFPIDLKLIRPKDEEYWDKYRTTPKAFVALHVIRDLWLPPDNPDAARTMPWVTAIKLTRVADASVAPDANEFAKNLLKRLSPGDAGFAFRPVRAEALAAANASTDFGMLFLSMSFFLVASAAGLIWLLMRLTVDRRASEIGILLASGFTKNETSRIIVREAMLVALGGLVLGVPLGVAYAASIVLALKTSWSGAVAEFPLALFVTARSVVVGGVAGLAVAALAIVLSARVLRRASAVTLLGGWQAIAAQKTSSGLAAKVSGVAALLAAGALLVMWWAFRLVPAPAAFALSGALLLVGLLALFSSMLQRRAARGGLMRLPPVLTQSMFTSSQSDGGIPIHRDLPLEVGQECPTHHLLKELPPSHLAPAARVPLSLGRLAFRSASRHSVRSLLTVGLLACATLLIVTAAAFRKNLALEYPGPKDSGSGGFSLLARSDISIYAEIGSEEGRRKLGLSADVSRRLSGARIYSLRESEGGDISCLNLERPKTPRVLGVPGEMIARGGFAFSAHEPIPGTRARTTENVWTLLEGDAPGGAVPAFADTDTAQWQMHVGLGDELAVPMPAGGEMKLRIVGLMSGSIFAGELLISEKHFTRHFGADTGYRFFLVECAEGSEPTVRHALREALGEVALDVDRTSGVLAAYASVENTYLSAFETLGGLGLVLATFGVVAVLLRSVIERRAELAMMLALGFTPGRVTAMVLLENVMLLVTGVAIGSGAALVAAAPHLVSTVADVKWLSLAGTLGATLGVGAASCALAARASVRGRLVQALRSE